MISWWNSLSGIEQILACVAIPSTIILFLQTILLLFSFGHDDMDADSQSCDSHDFHTGDDITFTQDAGIEHDFSVEHDFHDGHDFHDHPHEVHDSGLRIFTVRGFIAFFCIFGWSGLVFLRGGMSSGVSILIATGLGFCSMVVIAFILMRFIKLQSDGTVNIKSTIGVSGTVYIPIPAKRGGVGKISAVVSGRFSEYDAVTDATMPLKTNTPVTVVSITGGNTLVVIKK